MVKEENSSESENSSDVEILDKNAPVVCSSGLTWDPTPSIKDENSHPSSSSGHLKSSFLAMGFSPVLVDKVFKENGDDDAEMLLEVLIRQSALQNLSPKLSPSLDDFSSSEDDQVDSPFKYAADVKVETEDPNLPSTLDGDKRSYLLTMNFSKEEVDLAINQLGENASIPELVDCIVTAQEAGFSEEKGINTSVDGDVGKTEEHNAESLFGMMEKTLCLLQMGFTEDEVSTAIDNFGPEVSILELADSIFATRLAYRVDKEGIPINVKLEPDWLGYATVTEALEAEASSSNAKLYDYEEVRVKRAKGVVPGSATSSYSNTWQQTRVPKQKTVWQTEPLLYGKMPSNPELVKEEIPERMATNLGGIDNGQLSRPPFFFYGNVVEVSQETWRTLSQFLYGIKPEFVNTQFFSAFIRKEGYIHNLPTCQRFSILPKPPMTIEDALPHTKRWWPSWDTRKQLSCINSDTKCVTQQCDQLRKMMMDARGILSREEQANILHNCKTLNLIWVGQYKLSPIDPDQVECILGYPRHHTQIWGLDSDERLKTLKYSFQTDTLGYYLSGLKSKFPDELRVLSIYSGIGGAEVALHRLGFHLKFVVSVEASEANRKILHRWWQNTAQSGQLLQFAGIEKLTIQKLEEFVGQFGGFDIIIGGNPGTFISASSSMSSLMGMDQHLFFEFVRVFQRVRSMMGRNS